MKIFLICSKRFYDRIPDIQTALEVAGHEITLPNSYHDNDAEARHRELGEEAHAEWKAGMLRLSVENIKKNDAVLVLNFEKDGVQNYIGGATFLEMYEAFKLGKQIYLYNNIPEGMLFDEMCAMRPVVINADLSVIC